MRSLSKGDFVFLFFLALSFSASAGILYYDTFLSKRQGVGIQVGIITYKNRTAEQKQAVSSLWWPVIQSGPVYNYDTIRTGQGSSAVIILNNETEIELNEQSMVLIMVENKQTSLSLKGGTLHITKAAASSPVFLNTGSGNISITSGSVILQETGSELSLRSVDGTAEITAGEGANPIFVTEKENFNLSQGTVQSDTVSILQPEAGRIYISPEVRTPVSFSWQPDTERLDLEVNSDRSFSKRVYRNQTTESGTKVFLAEGLYYWRIVGSTASGSFSVLRGIAPKISVSDNRRILKRGSSVPVSFNWSSAGSAELYRLEVYQTGIPENPIKSLTTEQRSLVLDFFDAGTYYWIVYALFGPEQVAFASVRSTFSIVIDKAAAPEITRATRQMVTWKPVPNAESYEIRAEDTYTSTKNPWLALSGTLTPGTWNLSVRAFVSGNPTDWSAPYTLLIREIQPLVPIFPLTGETVTLSAKKLSLSWKDPNLGAKYRVLVSASPDLSSPVMSETTGKTVSPLTLNGISPGTWYWKASLVDENNTVTAETEMQSFTVLEKLAFPRPISPLGGEQLELNELKSITLRWKGDPNADFYTVNLYRMTGGIRSLISMWTTKDTAIVITDLTQFALDSFAWELVSQKTDSSSTPITSDPALSYFRIVQSEKLALPTIRKMNSRETY